MTIDQIKKRPQRFHLVTTFVVAPCRRRWFNRDWHDNDNEKGVEGE